MFNLILVILVVEIISGIIIDTFGALREEHNKITESLENKCMICGKIYEELKELKKEYVVIYVVSIILMYFKGLISVQVLVFSPVCLFLF